MNESGRPRPAAGTDGTAGARAYGGMLMIVAGCTAIAALMDPFFDPANLTMIYLLGVVVTAIAFGRGPAVWGAVLSVAVFLYAFIPPRFTWTVADTQYLVTLGVMLVVAVVIGTLTAWLREQREGALLREERTAALYRLSRDSMLAGTSRDVAVSAAQRIAEVMEARVAICLGEPGEALQIAAGDDSLVADEKERAVIRRVHENGQVAPMAGEGGASTGFHIPLEAGASVLGVLSVRPRGPGAVDDRERFHLLRALAGQTALALERCRLAEDNDRVRLQAETERTRSALLSSVSHDLRTPLASITGAASSLRHGAGTLSAATREELAGTIAEEALRLNRLIGNLLDMTRLESGALAPRKDWYSLEEVVGAALTRLDPTLQDREVRVDLPDDLPLVPLDDVLFEQVVRNLVENAHKYSPAREPIELSAGIEENELRIEVADRGPGLGPGDEAHVFEKFYRGANASGQPGVGLGLPICQAIVRAHGGTIEATSREGGGALFTVRIPLERAPAALEDESLEPEPAGTGA